MLVQWDWLYRFDCMHAFQYPDISNSIQIKKNMTLASKGRIIFSWVKWHWAIESCKVSHAKETW